MHIKDTLLAEYVRLTAAEAELQVKIEMWRLEIDLAETQREALLDKIHALNPAIEAYGARQAADDEGYIADTYTRGWPLSFITQVLNDTSDRDWTEDDVEVKAKKLGLKRPIGWTEGKAKEDFNREEEENETWTDRICGLPAPGREIPKALPPPEPKTAPTVASPPPPPPPPPTPDWTEDRVAIVRRDYPTYRPKDDILADVNALPGTQITDNQLNAQVAKLGLRRPADFMDRLRAERRPEDYMTPERLAVAKRLVIEGQTPGQYCPVLARMPGPPLPADKTVQNRLRAMGIRWEPTPLYCTQCGEPRHSSSASLCRRCYEANAAEKKVGAQDGPKEKETATPSAPAIPAILPRADGGIRTRDGSVSVAALQERDTFSEMVSAPREIIVDWAKRNKIGLNSNGKLSLTAVNAARQQAGLPPFKLTVA